MSSANLKELGVAGAVLTVKAKDGDEADLLAQFDSTQVLSLHVNLTLYRP